MKIKPLFDRVLIIPVKSKNTTQSGIILTARESSGLICGKVTATGEPMQVKADDTVIFEEHTACKFNIGEQPYYLIKQLDILAILKEEL